MTDDEYTLYQEERAEARACGDTDFPSFDVWSGVLDSMVMAHVRLDLMKEEDPR